MTLLRRDFLPLLGAAIAAPAVMRRAFAAAPDVTLKLHHYLSPVSNVHTKVLVPWARKVERDSGSRIRIDIFPSMQLGGTARELYDQARDGIADLVWTQSGNTPGRFPGLETFELPFVAGAKSVTNAKAAQAFCEQNLRDEFKDVRLICVCAHDGGLVHASRAVRTMHDLRGLRLRAPTYLASEALKALGAHPVIMPLSQVADATVQKAIDGCLTPWEILPALKLPDYVKYHAQVAGSPALYTATFVFAMNKAKYDSLPADLKKIIDANSGQFATTFAAEMWDQQGALVEDAIKKRGDVVETLTAEEAARWRKATEPVIDAWLKQAKDAGRDGGKLLDNARMLLAKYANS